MSTAFKIRLAEIEDMPVLMGMLKNYHYELRLRRYIMFEDNIDGWLDWLAERVQNPNYLFIVGEDGDGPCAMLCSRLAGTAFAPQAGLKAWNELLWIEREKRHLGYADKLIEEMSLVAKELGCSHATLNANKGFKGWKKIGKLYRQHEYELEVRTFIRSL